MKTRKLERISLIYHLRVFETQGGTLLGHLVDITSNGLKLIGENPVRRNRPFSLRMDLPRNVMAGGHLTFDAKSKWCRKDPNGEYYHIGMKVVNMPARELAVVQRLTSDFHQEPGGDDSTEGMNPPV